MPSEGPNVAVKGKSSAKSGLNQEQILYDNKPNHTHTHTHTHRKVDTLHIKAKRGGKKPVETSNCNEEQAQ